MIFGREPARWIGLIIALIAAVVRVLVGDDLLSADQADAVINAATKVGDVLLLLAPLIAAELIRRTVTPVAAPQLPNGTTVAITSTTDGSVIENCTL